MDKVEEYRQRAGECRTMAAMAPNAEIREHYLQLAKVWDQLADERLAMSGARGKPPGRPEKSN